MYLRIIQKGVSQDLDIGSNYIKVDLSLIKKGINSDVDRVINQIKEGTIVPTSNLVLISADKNIYTLDSDCIHYVVNSRGDTYEKLNTHPLKNIEALTSKW